MGLQFPLKTKFRCCFNYAQLQSLRTMKFEERETRGGKWIPPLTLALPENVVLSGVSNGPEESSFSIEKSSTTGHQSNTEEQIQENKNKFLKRGGYEGLGHFENNNIWHTYGTPRYGEGQSPRWSKKEGQLSIWSRIRNMLRRCTTGIYEI